MDSNKVSIKQLGFFGSLAGFAVSMYESHTLAAIGFIILVIFFAQVMRAANDE